jgi:NADH dehydrogenase
VAQRVFVTGGTGFVGKAVIRALLAQGFLVRCLVRPGSEHDLKGFESIDRVPGDVLQPDGLAASVEGCSALVHLVGIIREQRGRGVTFDRLHTQATRNMLALARAAGIKRFAQMSALGARPGARARYHQTKWEAEEAVRASDLEWTIFRPSIIFGRGDAFMSVLGRAVKRLPVMPVLGDGRYRLQPIPVEQVAKGFGRALRTPESVRQTYEVAGPTPYAFVDLLDEIGRALARARVRKLHVPLAPVRAMTRALDWLPFYPLSTDQLIMLGEESVTDPSRFFAELGLQPEPLAAGLKRMFAAP